MLDITWAMEQFGIEDKNIAIRILEKFDKFNYGCFSCGSSTDLLYTEIGEVICKDCRKGICINNDGLIDSEELQEVFELAFAEEDDEWLDDDTETD
ncbi:hypothetical protein FD723_05275 [Nostoc sp. C052]|uniref:hypothetical protein n=1 Tax=Nostoc sp. C052 TaxID=2576902 RepID=UPI0015C2F78B|nr:hypothetical protein [Nostoc sp. C052]QLE39938.1 hypothetical protein FD723_05275 [Nostoc sp. C052]